MKKTWLVVALLALGVMAVNSFADVQNIRLSGDIRIRGYYLNGTDYRYNNQDKQVPLDAAFIAQRTRVTVEADLEDHVLVVVTLAAEGTWGSSDQINGNAGAGVNSQGDYGSALNRKWDVGINEAYVQLNQAFFSPATLKIGRQYLHYGNGLILSSVDQEFNYDAGRLVLDYYPLTVDLVGAQIVNRQTFSNYSDHNGAGTLLFANARYELSDSAIKSIEGYFGWLARSDSEYNPATYRAPATRLNASPMIVGLRANGNNHGMAGGTLDAFLVNAGIKVGLKDTQWTPTFNATYTVASGGSRANSNFVPWFDYVEGYNGYLFCPVLSNIHIFNVGASVKPYENTTLAVQAYYYMKFNNDGPAGSNGNIDFGGPYWTNNDLGSDWTTDSADLGWEIDASLGYDYSKDVRVQLVYGIFIPGQAYAKSSSTPSWVAQEVRAEIGRAHV